MLRILIGVALMSLAFASDAADSKAFPYTPDGIKSIAANIQTVSLTPQIDGRTYLVEIEMKRDPFVGGGQDWNSVSSEVYNISKTLLRREKTSRIAIKFRSPKNNNFDWATVFIRRDRLPPEWAELTYHQFFARVEPMPGSNEATKWLCEYYNTYRSARPGGRLPHYCLLKD